MAQPRWKVLLPAFLLLGCEALSLRSSPSPLLRSALLRPGSALPRSTVRAKLIMRATDKLPDATRIATLRQTAVTTALAVTARLQTAATTRPLVSLGVAFVLGCVVGITAAPGLQLYWARYRTVEDIPPSVFRTHASISAKVIKVTDGDTYRVRHLPPLSGFRGDRTKAEGGSAKLSEETLQVRIAAVDTPETAKFGAEGMPLGDAATDFVKTKLLGRRVTIKPLARDQYGRAVSTVTYGSGPLGLFPVNISEELLRQGLAVVYRQVVP